MRRMSCRATQTTWRLTANRAYHRAASLRLHRTLQALKAERPPSGRSGYPVYPVSARPAQPPGFRHKALPKVGESEQKRPARPGLGVIRSQPKRRRAPSALPPMAPTREAPLRTPGLFWFMPVGLRHARCADLLQRLLRENRRSRGSPERLHQRLRREWRGETGEALRLKRSRASGRAVVASHIDDRH